MVDAYDAMTNDRSYRPAMSVSAARKELRRCAGTQFDPYIVAEFLQLLKEKEDVEKPSAEKRYREGKRGNAEPIGGGGKNGK